MMTIHSEAAAVVIAHYHPEGRVAAHLVNFIAYISSHVTPHIVLVSTGISDESRERVESYCQVIRRENIGYDFWSYKVGLQALPQNINWSRWVIINSSIVISNPAMLAEELFSRPPGHGLVGLTCSEDIGAHVQSYCVAFEGEEFLRSGVMRKWWGDMQPISERQRVIDVYEVGMTQYFARNGVPVRVLYLPTQGEKAMAIMRSIVESGRQFNISANQWHFSFSLSTSNNLNPTHYMWDAIFKRFGIIKLDFLRKSIFSSQLLSYIQESPDLVERGIPQLIDDALK